jgi:integrase
MEMCRKYDIIAETIRPGRTYFFQSPKGGAYANDWLIAVFHQCWEMSGNGSSRGRCVPYDFRHNFASQLLMRWTEEGKDLAAWLPYLSAYMGHASFSSTFYYIHLLPQRLSQMDFTHAGAVIPEVANEKENS